MLLLMKTKLLPVAALISFSLACGPASPLDETAESTDGLAVALDNPLVFDARRYIDTYPDVEAAYGSDEAGARQHWLANGIREGRRASVVFDVRTYLLLNDDVRASVGTDHAAAIRHYLTGGLRIEGRRAALEFDPRDYLQRYGDLRSAFGAANYEAAARHFMGSGLLREGRKGAPEFDVSYYICHHSDLARLFVGPNYSGAFTHWLRNGSAEGRRSSTTFALKYYVEGYADLKQLYGSKLKNAIHHWLANGRDEGRTAAPSDNGGRDWCPTTALGGTFSVGDVPGMRDLSAPDNTAKFRARGGRLYIHELGWIRSSPAERAAIAQLYPEPPIFETNLAQAAGSLTNNVLPYFPQGVWVTCVQQTTTSVPRTAAEITDLRNKLGGKSKLVGAYFSPNNAEAMKIPFDSPHWDEHRAAMLAGGVVCVDAPPQFYLTRPDYYREWAAKQIAWAIAHDIVVVYSLYPMGSTVGLRDATSTIKDLARRGALPTVWAVNGYYATSNPNRLRHPLGNEDVVESSANIALGVQSSYPR